MRTITSKSLHKPTEMRLCVRVCMRVCVRVCSHSLARRSSRRWCMWRWAVGWAERGCLCTRCRRRLGCCDGPYSAAAPESPSEPSWARHMTACEEALKPHRTRQTPAEHTERQTAGQTRVTQHCQRDVGLSQRDAVLRSADLTAVLARVGLSHFVQSHRRTLDLRAAMKRP